MGEEQKSEGKKKGSESNQGKTKWKRYTNRLL